MIIPAVADVVAIFKCRKIFIFFARKFLGETPIFIINFDDSASSGEMPRGNQRRPPINSSAMIKMVEVGKP